MGQNSSLNNENLVEQTSSLNKVVQIEYLSPADATFCKNGDFLGLKIEKDGETTEYPRVFLHRMFPFEELWEHISVLTGDNEEVGMIASVEDFDEDAAALLKEELDRKYLMPTITAILNLKERFGFSTWKVESSIGTLEFTLRDTYRSMMRVGDGRMIITDSDGNRYEIPDVNKLDKKSFRKIELYL